MNRATIETDVAVPTLSGPSLPATQALTTPSDLTPDHPVAILGWFEGRGASSTSGGETIEQKAARVEWAFVVKLKLRSIERRPRRRWQEAGPMPGKANWKQRIRGVIGAGLLAVVCVYLSAACIAWQDSPAPIHYLWPHLDPLLAPLVLAPAVALWWYYFTYHWRGRRPSWRGCSSDNQTAAVLALPCVGVCALLALDDAARRPECRLTHNTAGTHDCPWHTARLAG